MIYFLEADRLGVLLSAFQSITHLPSKKARRGKLNDYCKSLHTLHLVPAATPIISVSYGVRRDGTEGLLIVCHDMETTVHGQTGPDSTLTKEGN